ncbi:ligase-associated DNA damage response DEXH box helicase [Parasediminibacterium sp. JCM 36343]|uniref:ligase-associated DNA damage response DEXH box helicase n=1 Tax=Parasediminibacterium sp. JCM 36343 TaxID=3374279 RepID=UPI00397DE389
MQTTTTNNAVPLLQATKGYAIVQQWLASKGLKPFTFQEEAWQHIINGQSGLVNAPTGCGKTYAVFLGSIIQFINTYPDNYQTQKSNGLQLLWVTPLRALAKDIGRAMEEVIAGLGLQWKVGIRNGDTSTTDRQKQKKNIPEVLIITPESLHLLLAQKGYPEIFKTVKTIAVDEWHELIGSKRGVQVELAISRIVSLCTVDRSPLTDTPLLTTDDLPLTTIWGISATIGNLEEAKAVLLASLTTHHSPLTTYDLPLTTYDCDSVIVKANLDKKIEIHSIIPDEIEKYPWAGHLGIKLAESIVPIIEKSKTTLVFINTRGMSERWYQTLLDIAPQFAGAIALHHGSMEQELRLWVEDALHTGTLKAVVCTASLDLGVDFRPVDTVIQVGSPKGVSRFLQRAGRSGHQPGETSNIYFLPTHSLELVEAAALKTAIKHNEIESKQPLVLCYDVLTQYLCTLAVGDGFMPDAIFKEVKNTFCFSEITKEEFDALINHITVGGVALQQYDEYKKVEIEENGLHIIKSRRIAMRHRMHIGTIVSDAMMKVKLMSGGYIGVIEEWFISRLETGDVFTLAGRNVELVLIKDMTAFVKKSTAKKSIVPSWMGGRMSLTANLGQVLRETFSEAATGSSQSVELKALQPLFDLQAELSHIPKVNELLIEQIESKDGYHLLVYPFEGRQVHEAMSALLAYRISKTTPITFSIAMNDYGFELLSDQPIPVDDSTVHELFTLENLLADIQRSVNSVEMAARKFRDIAVIGGLIFQGMPGEQKKARHLQSSASLLFKVFSEYDPNNLLLRQAYNEVLSQQMEEQRLRVAMHRILQSTIIIQYPQKLTPLSFPIIADGLNRNNLSSETLENRIKKMQQQLAG